MALSIVILAAGQGTRMKSDLPKVMHRLAGRPMVCYVLDTARSVEPAALAVVVGVGADQVREAVGDGVTFATQEEQLGTGHAVQQAEAVLAGRAETVLVLYGDTPLIRPGTLREMVGQHHAEGATITLLTFRPENPTGYGRIVRDAAGGPSGRVLAVVEDREATAEQRAIGEVNSGILCFRDEWLWPNLARLAVGGPHRAGQKEIYLTDLVGMAQEQGKIVIAVPAPDPLEVMGLDHRAKLAQAEAELRRRINERWMLNGVTIVHPEATYIEAGVEIGADTEIWPNTLLQGQTRIGRGCVLGPGSIIRDSTIGDGCRVELSVLEGAIMEDGSEIRPFSHLGKGAHLGPGVHVGNYGAVTARDLPQGSLACGMPARACAAQGASSTEEKAPKTEGPEGN